MSEFVEQCRREWRRLGVADPLAEEMAADLTSDLDEAEAEGVSAAEYLGSSASDPRSFAASWASERGIIPTPPGPEQGRRRPPALVAFTALAAITVIVAALLLATGEPKVGTQDNQNDAAPPSPATGTPHRTRRHRPSSSGKRRCAGRVDPPRRRARRARLLRVAVAALEPLATTDRLARQSSPVVIARSTSDRHDEPVRPMGATAARRAWTRFGWAGLAIAMLIGTGAPPAAAAVIATSADRDYGASTYQPTSPTHSACDPRGAGLPRPQPIRAPASPRNRTPSPTAPRHAANDACKHLLSERSTGAVSTTAPATPSPSGPGAVATDCLTLPTSPCYTPDAATRRLRHPAAARPRDHRPGTDGRPAGVPTFRRIAVDGHRHSGAGVVRYPTGPGPLRQPVPSARREAAGRQQPRARAIALAGIHRGSGGHRGRARARAGRRHPRGPDPVTVRRQPSPGDRGRRRRLRLALTQGGVVSLSAGAGEQCFTPAEVAQVDSVLQAAQRKHVTMIVSTGDSGAATTACPPETGSATVKGVDLPASDPLALAVGGTSSACQPEDRRLHRRDRVEHPSLGGGTQSRRQRLQPAVPPARLPDRDRRPSGPPGACPT